MIPSLRDTWAQPIEVVIAPPRDFGYIHIVGDVGMHTSRISGNVEAMLAYRQAVWHILHSERFNEDGGQITRIYPINFGVDLRQFIGMPFEYLYSKIDQVLDDALMQDDRTVSTEVTKKELVRPGRALVEFDVATIDGRISFDKFEIPLS